MSWLVLANTEFGPITDPTRMRDENAKRNNVKCSIFEFIVVYWKYGYITATSPNLTYLVQIEATFSMVDWDSYNRSLVRKALEIDGDIG